MLERIIVYMYQFFSKVAHLWAEFKNGHMYRHEDDVYNALKGCFGQCGTCVHGNYLLIIF